MADKPQLKLSYWHGRENYGCPYCAFDSLNEQTTLDHVYEVHVGRPSVQPIHGDLFDAAGNLIPRK